MVRVLGLQAGALGSNAVQSGFCSSCPGFNSTMLCK